MGLGHVLGDSLRRGGGLVSHRDIRHQIHISCRHQLSNSALARLYMVSRIRTAACEASYLEMMEGDTARMDTNSPFYGLRL